MQVVVIGAGVMGCGVAWRLAQAGARVLVLERAIPGAEASSAAAGILGAQAENEAPGPLLDLCLASRQRWPDFAAELHALTGIDVHLEQHGLLELGFTPAEIQRQHERAEWMRALGLRAEILDPEQALELQPAVNPQILGALHLPEDGQVEPRLLMQALRLAALRAGVEIRSGQTVKHLEMQQNQVLAILTETERIPADAVVLAAGAWTDLVPGLDSRRTTIAPQHGQLLMLKTETRLFAQTLAGRDANGRHGYLVPRRDGRVVVGATSEAQGYAKTLTADGRAWLLDMARKLAPALANAEVLDHWSGLRPQSGDGLPLLGEHRAVKGLVLASGHHRNGILLAPVTAEVAARAVLGERQTVEIGAFLP